MVDEMFIAVMLIRFLSVPLGSIVLWLQPRRSVTFAMFKLMPAMRLDLEAFIAVEWIQLLLIVS